VEAAHSVKFVPRLAHSSHQVSPNQEIIAAFETFHQVSCIRNESNGETAWKSHSHLESSSIFKWRAYSSTEIWSWPRISGPLWLFFPWKRPSKQPSCYSSHVSIGCSGAHRDHFYLTLSCWLLTSIKLLPLAGGRGNRFPNIIITKDKRQRLVLTMWE